MGGQPWTNFLKESKDAQLNSTSFDTSIVTGERWGHIVLFKKLLEKWILRGLKLRRFDQNQVNDSKLNCQNVRNNKISNLENLYSKPPTHIDVTYAISKFDQKF